MTTGLAALCALLLGAGAAILTAALMAGAPAPTAPVHPRSRRGPSHLGARIGLAVVLGALVGWVTGWPAAAGWSAAFGFGLPSLAGTGGRRSAAVARIEGVAAWAEMLRDQAAAGADLAQAVQASAAHAPAAIAAPVARLAIRLRRQPPTQALAAFADEVADPTADLVATALAVAFTQQARRVGDLLATLASSAREQAGMRLRVERDRARIRTVARATGGVVLGWTVLVYVASGQFFAAYDDPVGQLMLLLVGALFALGVIGLARLDRLPTADRLLVGRAARGSLR